MRKKLAIISTASLEIKERGILNFKPCGISSLNCDKKDSKPVIFKEIAEYMNSKN